MTQQEKQIKNYLSALDWNLRLPKATRGRICADVRTDLCTRMEQGERFEEITATLGAPAQLAEGFNEEIAAPVRTKGSPLRFLFLVPIAIGVLLLIYSLAMRMWASSISDVAIIGGADGPTAIYITSSYSNIGWLYLSIVLGCAAAYVLCRAGRGGPRRQYLIAACFSGAGIAVYIGYLAMLIFHSLSEMTNSINLMPGAMLWQLFNLLLLPGFWLPLITLILSIRAMRRG